MIIGDTGTGKSSFFSQLVKNESLKDPNPTIELEFATKITNKSGHRIIGLPSPPLSSPLTTL